MYAIFDLDNCLADDAWRVETIKHECADVFEKYDSYHCLAIMDKLANANKLYAHANDKIIILTARPECYRAMTEKWLLKHWVKYTMLLMRPNDSHEHSAVLKLKLIKEHGINPEEISCAYDDRQDVIDAYKSIGINASVLKINDIDYYGEKKHEHAA